MKIDVPRILVEDAIEQLAAVRGCVKNKGEWDLSALGRLYSLLIQETGGRSNSSAIRSSARKNSRRARSRFSK